MEQTEIDNYSSKFEYGYECARQILSDTPGLDGILAAVDIQGFGAIRVLTEMRISLPNQVKVISLTGHAVGGMLESSMTSTEMPAHEMGKKAATMVIEEIVMRLSFAKICCIPGKGLSLQ